MAVKRIMIVDDSLSVRQMVKATLEEGGYETSEAKDGEEALERFRSAPVDLVITDLNMPR
ncbi:MAG: response regulator, partial [Desulfuromonadales bacterium]|nr:response regulator [Desulfuromonadales bacterium]